jgi:uncharacterized RDD family membrane protein YckC
MDERPRDSFSSVSEDLHRVEVPEHVEIAFTLAGFGSRFIAYLIDLACMILLVAILFAAMLALILTLSKGFAEALFGGQSMQGEGLVITLVISLFGLALFIVSWFYFLIFELLWDGKSPGKRALGIRVIRDEGGKITFYASLLRNLLRVADWLPSFYFVGMIAMFANRKWKRLGDLAAGTIVVKEEKEGWSPEGPLAPPPIGAGELDAVLTGDVLEKMGREYHALCQDYLRRRDAIDPFKKAEIAKAIALEPMRKLDITGMEPDTFIEILVNAWRRKTRT